MIFTNKLRRPSALLLAGLLFLTTLVPLLSNHKAGAYQLLGPRQIKMQTSAVSATNVSYRVKFRIASDASNLGGIVVTFCEGADSPIINDTACTVPAGFDVSAATINGQTDGTNIQDDEDGAPLTTADITTFDETGGSVQTEDLDDSGATTENTVTISNSTAVTAANIDANDYVAFTINDVVNPSAVGTFYARIYTYTTEAAAQGYTLANPAVVGAPVDAGGIALSTAQQITITSKVQERLTFCVYASDAVGYANNDCASKTSTGAIALGDTNGVLDPGGPFVDKAARYSITTNAASNAVVRAKGATLTSGAFTVDPIGAGTAETDGDDDGNIEQFGFCNYEFAGTGLSIDADYDGDNGTNTCLDTFQTSGQDCTGILDPTSPSCATANAANDVNFAFLTSELTSTYGSLIATKAPGAYSTGTLAFLGNIDNTTQAGIYTTTLTFIATGTY